MNPFVVQISVGMLIGNILNFVKARIVYVCLKTKKVKEYTSFTFHRHCTITNIIQTIIESLLSKSFPSWWVNRETAGVANSIRSIKVCLIDRTLVVHMLMYVCGSYLKGILHSIFIIYAPFAISFVYHETSKCMATLLKMCIISFWRCYIWY